MHQSRALLPNAPSVGAILLLHIIPRILATSRRSAGGKTMKSMIALAALATLGASPPPAPDAARRANGGHSMLGASDRAATAEIRAAEARLTAHLEGDDPLAWVRDYTEDAVFQEGEDAPVAGRAALTKLARSIGPLSDVKIVPVRTFVSGRLAYVQVRGRYAVGKGAPSRFSGVMVWRKDRDGVWRMLHEMLAKAPAGR